MKLLTLGPAGTYSHEAAQNFHPDAEIVLLPNFDVLIETLSREGGVGFLPIENSRHGSVDEVLDQLVRTGLCIWRTEDVAIRHSFGALDPAQVKKIATRPEALAQCGAFLRREFHGMERIPVASSTAAIKLALQDPTIGAIASASAMREYRLPIVHEDIHDPGNMTRFGLIAREDPFLDAKRTTMSIVLHTHTDRPGLLHDLLTPFKVYDVNITKLESRPTGEKLGDYIFFIDFLGTRDSARVQKTLAEVREVAEIQVIGEW